MQQSNKVIIFSAPSGSGKSTIVNYLTGIFPQLEFSISATSRAPRGKEKNGKEYYFFSYEQFLQKVAGDEFVEHEEVYCGSCYGTLKSEVERIWSKGNTILFDVDVKGGINLKRIFGDKALSFFIQVPSLEELKQRLIKRGTDSIEAIEKRVAKAEIEMSDADKFDIIIVNDNLEICQKQAENYVRQFLSK